MEINEQTIAALQDVYMYCCATSHFKYNEAGICYCPFYANGICAIGHPFGWDIKAIDDVKLR